MQASQVIYACYGKSSVTTDQSHPSSTWDANYVGVYHLSNGTTLSGNDSTANANNSSIGTNASFSSGEIGGGAYFNGSGTGIYNNSTTIPASSPITVSFWAYVTTGELGSYSAFNIGTGYVANRIQAHAPFSDSNVYWDYGDPTDGSGRISTSYASYENVWSYVTLTASASGHAIYFDGSLAKSNISSVLPNGSESGLDIGNNRNLSNLGYNGTLDEFRVSAIARSPSWILTEYNNQSSPSTFYALGSETSGGSGGGGSTSTIQSLIIGTSTYNRYFYLSDVYRDGSGNIVTSGGTYDPSTKQVTVVYGWPGGTVNTMTTDVVRGRNNALSQNSWSGGPGQGGPETSTNNQFASSSNIDYATGTGSIYVAIPGY